MNVLTLLPAAITTLARSAVAYGIIIGVAIAAIAVFALVSVSIVKNKRLESEELPEVYFDEDDYEEEEQDVEEEGSAFSLDLDDNYAHNNGEPISEAEEMFQKVRSQPTSRRAAREEEKSFFSRFKK